MSKPLKIASMPVDRGGCGHYRIRQPFTMIKAFTDADTYILDKEEEGDKMVQVLSKADVAVVRQGGEFSIPYLKQMPEFKHLKWVVDIDDNMEIISPYSQHYEEYGTQEYFDPTIKQWVWKEGENSFNLKKNRMKVMSFLVGMKEADMVTVTTPKLAEYARQFNKNVAILPNSIDPDQWWQTAPNLEPQLRVGWSGGISHYEDWYTIKKPLNKLLRKYKFKLVVIGTHFTGIVDEDLRYLVEVHPWVPFEAHSWHMQAMKLDIALIPLADLPFNKFKSAIKFYEMSALGIPSVVANLTPYKEDVMPQIAAPYDNEDKFYEWLENLILEPTVRLTMGEEARKWVLETQNAQKRAKDWETTYNSIL